jgi:hypothetical protein
LLFEDPSEAPDEHASQLLEVEVRPRLRMPWSRKRWIAALAANSVVALVFGLAPDLIGGLVGYLMGWLVACFILMW